MDKKDKRYNKDYSHIVFTTGQVAKICELSVQNINNYFDDGRLKGYHIPPKDPNKKGHRRVPYNNLVDFMIDYEFYEYLKGNLENACKRK